MAALCAASGERRIVKSQHLQHRGGDLACLDLLGDGLGLEARPATGDIATRQGWAATAGMATPNQNTDRPRLASAVCHPWMRPAGRNEPVNQKADMLISLVQAAMLSHLGGLGGVSDVNGARHDPGDDARGLGIAATVPRKLLHGRRKVSVVWRLTPLPAGDGP